LSTKQLRITIVTSQVWHWLLVIGFRQRTNHE